MKIVARTTRVCDPKCVCVCRGVNRGGGADLCRSSGGWKWEAKLIVLFASFVVSVCGRSVMPSFPVVARRTSVVVMDIETMRPTVVEIVEVFEGWTDGCRGSGRCGSTKLLDLCGG